MVTTVAAGVDGVWSIGPESVVGYRVDESINGFDTTANLGPGGWYPLPFDLAPLVEPRAAHAARLLPDNSLVLLGPGVTSESIHF